jgi:hypothetical protein
MQLLRYRYGFPKGTYEGSLGEDNEFSMRSITKKSFLRYCFHHYGKILHLRKIFFKMFTLPNFHLEVGKFLTVLLILLSVAFGYLFRFEFESKGNFKSTRV